MKTKTQDTERIRVVTLGCAKNVYDSEVLSGQLTRGLFEVSHSEEDPLPGTVIINTCGFIESAREESIETILGYAKARKEGLIRRLIVTGCLSQRYMAEMPGEIPEVDHWFGTGELPALLQTLKTDYRKDLLGQRMLSTPQHYAYLKISEGCDRTCSFCAIPGIRGKHRSRPASELVSEAEQLAAAGVKELILIAQDLTWYGLDLNGKRQLAPLLEKLVSVNGLEWIRIHYAYPGAFPLDVLPVIQNHEKICKYIDIPFQHASDRILKAMKRGASKAQNTELINTIRASIPGVAIRTTLITGFPGEIEEDFDILHQWIKDMAFDRLGIFTYSHEEGTDAYRLEDDVPEDVKNERADTIMATQESISESHNNQYRGQSIEVMVDNRNANGTYYNGRTRADSPEVDNAVIIKSNRTLNPGDIINVIVEDSLPYDLICRY